MPRETWILVTIALSPGRALQPLQLQSAMSVLSRKLTSEQLQSDDFYRFERHDYGTFSLAVHLDAERMGEADLLVIDNDLWPARQYVLTSKGDAAAHLALARLPLELVRYVEAMVRWITSYGIGELMHVRLDDYCPFPAYDC